MKKYYVAYGSNLNVEQMEYRCPDAKAVGTSEIADYELLFKGSKTGSYLTIEKCAGSYVPVGIWEVSAADEKKLDRYEGCPTFYYKKAINLTLRRFDGTDEEITAFVYIMHEDRKIGIPTLEYVNTCTKGYDDFGFDIAPLMKAMKTT